MAELHYQYSTASTSTESRPIDPVAFAGVSTLAGLSNTVVLQDKQSDRRMIVTADVAAALAHCSTYLPLGQHAKNLCTAMPPLRGQEASVTETLKQVAQSGLLTSASEAVKRLSQGSTSAQDQQPLHLCVITKDRPEALQRLLNSMSPQLATGKGRHTDFACIWVIDDSREPENQRKNAQVCAHFNASNTIKLEHVDIGLKTRIMAELRRDLPEHAESLEFLLDTAFWGNYPSYGAARNWAQLLTAGHRAIVLDDDILLQAIAPPLAQKPWKFGSLQDIEAAFYTSPQEQAKHTLAATESPLDLMADHVGERLHKFINRQSGAFKPSDLVGANAAQVNRFTGTSVIKLCQVGYWGDPGTQGGNWLLNLKESSVQRLLDLSSSISETLDARSVWLGFRATTITPYAAMSAMTGMDNTTPLPPYLPVGRGEDQLFGIMTQRIYPDSCVANLPWSVPHKPLENRAHRNGLRPPLPKPNTTLLSSWLGKEPEAQWGRTPDSLLRQVADEVRYLCDLQSSNLEALVRKEFLELAIHRLSQVKTQQKIMDSHSNKTRHHAWENFLRESDQVLGEFIQMPQEAFAQKHQENFAFDEENMRVQGLAFAQAIEAWPHILDAAKNLSTTR